MFGNEEEEADRAMFNIGEEPVGRGARNALFTGEQLSSALCNDWGGSGGDRRASPMFSPNSILSTSSKVNIGDCSVAFVDHRRWGGPENKMEKEEYEKRGAEVLMRLSNYKPPVQERNEENEWDAITSYVTAEPVEEIARARDVAAAEKKREVSECSTSSGRFRGRVGSTKLSVGGPVDEEIMAEKEEDDQLLPHSSGFNVEKKYEGNDRISRRFSPQPLSSSACSVPQMSSRGGPASTSEEGPAQEVEMEDGGKGTAEKASLHCAGSSSGSKRCRSAGSQGAPTPKSTGESEPKPSEASANPSSATRREDGAPSANEENSEKPAESPKSTVEPPATERKASTFSPTMSFGSPRGYNALRQTKKKETALRLLALSKKNEAKQ